MNFCFGRLRVVCALVRGAAQGRARHFQLPVAALGPLRQVVRSARPADQDQHGRPGRRPQRQDQPLPDGPPAQPGRQQTPRILVSFTSFFVLSLFICSSIYFNLYRNTRLSH